MIGILFAISSSIASGLVVHSDDNGLTINKEVVDNRAAIYEFND